MVSKQDDQQNIRANHNQAPSDSVSTLLPMLVGGLVLIVIAMIAIVILA